MNYLSVVLLAIILSGLSYGQCVRESVRTNAVRGVVFGSIDGGKKELLSRVVIRLLKNTKEVYTTYSGDNGEFSIVNVIPGKYTLKVHVFGLEDIVIGLQVIKSSKRSNSLKIRLAPPSSTTDSCDGDIEVGL